jgi:hypothetical protein
MAKFMKNNRRAKHDYEGQQPGGNEINHQFIDATRSLRTA